MADSFRSYTVAWIAALPHERAAGEIIFDTERDDAPPDFRQSIGDSNEYSWGRIGKHNVVIVSLSAGPYGLVPAATVAQALKSSLPHIRLGLLVGIGAGIPGEKEDEKGNLTVKRDIRLGDIVVSSPDTTQGGVVQFDFAKMTEVQ